MNNSLSFHFSSFECENSSKFAQNVFHTSYEKLFNTLNIKNH